MIRGDKVDVVDCSELQRCGSDKNYSQRLDFQRPGGKEGTGGKPPVTVQRFARKTKKSLPGRIHDKKRYLAGFVRINTLSSD